MKPLKKSGTPKSKGPVVLIIMDGVGNSRHEAGDAVRSALTPHLDWLDANVPTRELKAHGKAVGLPSDDDMGNSEVGHNAIGAGRVFTQGSMLINRAIDSGSIWQGEAWKKLIENCRCNDSRLHVLGLLSDGNVHSDMHQIKALFRQAAQEGVTRSRLHALLDGRDVPPTSALEYVDDIESFFAELNTTGDRDYRIASGGGRMQITMDRYNANWSMIDAGWKIHVHGDGRMFESARTAIETLRSENHGVIDQDLPPFVVAQDGCPVGRIEDGDSVVLANFRGDRAIEISRAFEEEILVEFERGKRPRVEFAGLMQYDGDLQIPRQFLVDPPVIDRTMGEYLTASGVSILAISETQKYGHVTYFFNGNRSGAFDAGLETYVEIPSDIIPFEQRPWMKAAEITDRVIQALEANEGAFIRVNFPNGDMVGHTGNFQATQISVESVDLSLGRLMKVAAAVGATLVISADHGNADEMFQLDGQGVPEIDPDTGATILKTSHSLNPVPVHVYDPTNSIPMRLNNDQDLGISSLAATCIKLLGFEPPIEYDPAVIEIG
jgi:2,3-bisphosphoglycerate-independent phosphoglycerate mutase